ncbi:MAG TPA: ATP-dependent sacrificial sulfur transferase LarE [Anaerolineae bacterium]|nr:ATP-dependent sacrificial sulfur transferase LarE [Anaerolineae bacterium]
MNTPSKLREIIAGLGSVAVAYSGGVDSSYLLAVCLDVLGPDRVLALTADSPLTPRRELAEARTLARRLGVRHIVLPGDELTNPAIAANPPDRCYHCKLGRFTALWEAARAEGLAHLVHGENADDAGDYRPGSRAAEELGVRAPLREAGLTKAEIRALSKAWGLPTWDKPANACLATRFPYHTPLSAAGLARVEAAEEALRDAWQLAQLRLRAHGSVARIEVPPEEIARLAQLPARTAAVEALRALGYRYVTLDLMGYRMGSLNDELESAGEPR